MSDEANVGIGKMDVEMGKTRRKQNDIWQRMPHVFLSC